MKRAHLLFSSMEKNFRRLMKASARNAFVEAEAKAAIAYQVRVLRTQRGLSQARLAKLVGTTQAAIARIEDPDYGRVTLSTLLQLAHAFDVALQVRFVSTIKLFKETRVIKRENLEVAPFEEEVPNIAWIESSGSPPALTVATTTLSLPDHAILLSPVNLGVAQWNTVVPLNHEGVRGRSTPVKEFV